MAGDLQTQRDLRNPWRTLLSRDAIIPYFLILWKYVGHASNVDFLVTRGKVVLGKCIEYLQSHDWIYLAIGFLWLGCVIFLRDRKGRRQVKNVTQATLAVAQDGTRMGKPTITQEPAPVIKITSPTDGAEVGFMGVVTGFVDPPNRPLQVFVFGASNLWYVQPKPIIDGQRWSARCQFGQPNEPGKSYRIIAIYGNDIGESRFPYLPEHAVKSNVVHVRRTYNE